MTKRSSIIFTAIACLLMFFYGGSAMNSVYNMPKLILPGGCDTSWIESAEVTWDSCTGLACVKIIAYVTGMHGIENWHFDFGNGVIWDTTTSYSNNYFTLPCPGGLRVNCDTIRCPNGAIGARSSVGTNCVGGVCTTFCNCICEKVLLTKCGVYTAPGTYMVTMGVTPAHTICLNSRVIQVRVAGPALSISIDSLNCDKNSATISASGGIAPYTYSWCNGDTGPSTSALLPGTSCIVSVTDKRGCVQTSIISCEPNTIPIHLSEKNISVFPNPSQGSFTIRMHALQTGNIRVRIFDYLGQEIYRSEENLTSSSHEKQIQLPNASKGVYLLRIDTGNGFIVKKFMIE